ncbi:MAG: hypothetical protein ACM3VT_20250 [Solirubrobacterales bacterium]
MKIAWMLVTAMCVAAMTAGGCGDAQNKRTQSAAVTAKSRSAFPAALAGRWRSDRHGWEFVIEPDGRISSAVISLGRVTVLAGQTTTAATKEGGQATFTPGPWTVDYDAATQMLVVKIVMTHVRVPMGPSILEGSSTDVFTGPVAPTSDTWQAQWTAFTDYKAQTGENKSIDLSTDKTYGDAQTLVFTKTAER